MAEPTGISGREVIRIVAEYQALGEINNVPPPQLGPIIAKLKKALQEKP